MLISNKSCPRREKKGIERDSVREGAGLWFKLKGKKKGNRDTQGDRECEGKGRKKIGESCNVDIKYQKIKQGWNTGQENKLENEVFQ